MPRVVRFEYSDSEDAVVAPVATSQAIAAQRAQLPMFRGRHDVVAEVRAHRVCVIVGETGSGKSTQLPQALLEADRHEHIVVSQPRRVAAMSLANRVAAEAGTSVGGLVGYNVRFDAKISKSTRIRYVTDGMLLREFMLDPQLSKYTTVIVDEAHERTITSDLVLGLLKQLLERRRHNFRIVIMSATLDADRFAAFFGGDSSRLYVPGRAFPVDRYYVRAPVSNIVDAAVQTVIQVNRAEPHGHKHGGGDILVFLPGQDEIETAAETLRAHKPEKGAPRLRVLPLYASLPEKEQRLAFASAPSRHERKVVLATNIAETSVTIPGVRFVIDSGLRKVRVHRSVLGLESLLPAPISQASAAQRMGRAGREGPGKCWRLYTEESYLEEMQVQTEPEISRVSLTYPILLLKRIGAKDVLNFPWVDPPTKVAIRNALLQLFSLAAIDKDGEITEFGRRMATLPLDPPLAAVLVSVANEAPSKIIEATLDVVACLSVPDLLVSPPAARREEITSRRQELFPAATQYGDLVFVKLLWDAFQAVPKPEAKEWCYSIGVSLRSLRRVRDVRAQLVEYLHGAKPTARRGSSSHERAANSGDNSSDDEAEAGKNVSLDTNDYETLIRMFMRGFVTNTAIALPDRRFQTTMTQQPVSIHPGSALFGQRPEAIMYLEYVYTVRGYARFVSPIEVDWLRQIAPHLLARAADEQTQ